MLAFSILFLLGQLLSAWIELSVRWFAAGFALWGLAVACKARRIEICLRGLVVTGFGLILATRAVAPPTAGCWLPAENEPQKLWVEAVVRDSPVGLEDGVRIRIWAWIRLEQRKQPVCGTILLTVFGPKTELSVGDRLLVHAHLRRPRNFGNPGARDQVGALARQGVRVSAYATSENVRRIGHESAGWREWVAAERRRIGGLIEGSLPAPEAALLRALIVGEANAVPADLWDEIARTGLAHLLSISGLHVGAVWGAGFVALRWIGSRSELLLLRSNVRALAASGAVIPAILYGILAGGSLPTERSLVMLLLPIVAVGREVRPIRVLVLAALLLALAHPGAPLDVSYQLSFVSVLSLIAGVEWWSRLESVAGSRKKWLLPIVVSTSALLGTAPLVAFHFNRVTPIGLLANPLLVPVGGLVPTLLGLAGVALSFASEPAAQALFALTYWPLTLLRRVVAVAARLPLACVRVPTPSVAETVLLYGILACPWVPANWRRATGAALCFALAIDAGGWIHERFFRSDVRIRFLDVGQGDSAVIELPRGRVLVVDGGGFPRSRFDVGERVVARYLWTRKILHVDFLAASHGDWDHQGGLHFLAEEFSPKELWRSDPVEGADRLGRLVAKVEEKGVVVRTLVPGEVAFERDGVSIRCLHPPAGERLSSNDSSLVLRLVIGDVAVILAGDVEAEGEEILRRRPEASRAAILKVPHHGSITSSTETWLRALHPEVAVISLGSGNPFRFPHPEVLARYARVGSRVVRTDLDGSVWAFTDGRRLGIRTFSRASPVFCSGLGALC